MTWLLRAGLYESDKPCEVCGKTPAGTNSWYCFTVCEDHASLSPVEIGNLIRKSMGSSPAPVECSICHAIVTCQADACTHLHPRTMKESSPPRTMKESIALAAAQLMALSQEEFDKRLEEASRSDLAQLFKDIHPDFSYLRAEGESIQTVNTEITHEQVMQAINDIADTIVPRILKRNP